MNRQKLFETIINVTGFTPLESDMDEIQNACEEIFKESQWVKTEHEKPELNQPVLVWCKIYGKFIATYEDIGAGKNWGNWRDSISGNLGILPPIYWMPLPEPPTK